MLWQRCNEEIADCDTIEDRIYVNNVKHRITFYTYMAPRVVFGGESKEEGGSGRSSGSHQLSGRGRMGGSQPHAGFSRDDMMSG